MASSSFTGSHSSHQWKYDVFLSFRGDDTRYNFTCHLYDALRRKGLEIFIDSHQLRRGGEIRTSLFQAIQNSNVAVVIFSKDYVSSTWCLNELVKIIECHETHGQIVVPIFFHVDPSHIRKQSGLIETSFSLHERDPNNSEKLPKWREALTKAANLSGWDSNFIREETKLIDAIVKDILEKLKHPSPCGLEHLVGMKFRIRQIKELLAFNSSDVRILGIYGMGGIGKTTLIETIYSLICSDFEGCCFVPNVKEESKISGLKKLLEYIMSEIFDQKDIIINIPNIGPGEYYIKRLRRKKILVALDDVSDPLQLASLFGDPCWFGPGSRIIITSRDKQVFEASTKYIYEMKPLTSDEALQLFSWNAFKRLCPTNDYVELSDPVVRYAQGNPLALKVLGSYLCGKNKEEWQSEVSKLSKIPKKTIQNILKVSYDDLDEEEKDMFLHIACFFKGEYKADAIHIFDSCGFSAAIGIRDLVDKSLITISKDDELEMHDLLQEMGKEIVRQESKDPCRRTRLWDSKDICQALTQTDGSHSVESISLDMSEIGDRDLNSDAFTRMPNLKFLKFYTTLDERTNGRSKLHLPQGLNYLPNEMRYLQWDAYPLKSLPVNFHPKNLFVLKLRNSKIEQLWKEGKDDSRLKLMESQIMNLGRRILGGCSSLVKVPLPLSHLNKVTSMTLWNCQTIRSLPSHVDLETLETLDLSHCSNLKQFPQISSNIRYLYLDGTAISEVPSSIERLSKLLVLTMDSCQLETLPDNICKLSSLKYLNLCDCKKLKVFPEIMEPMENLKDLAISYTGIETLPSSFTNLKGLASLGMFGLKLNHVPSSVTSLNSLRSFRLTLGEKLVWSMPPLSFFSSMKQLILVNGNLWKFPEDLSFLCSLEELFLGGNDMEEISSSIKQLSQLKVLFVSACARLQSLPELPPSLVLLQARDCESLKTISTLSQLTRESENLHCIFNMADCFMLDGNECEVIINEVVRSQRFAYEMKHQKGNINLAFSPPASEFVAELPYFAVCYPGTRIPECFLYQSRGNSIKVQLPLNWLNDCFSGFAVCIHFKELHFPRKTVRYKCYFEGGNNHYTDSVYNEFFITSVPPVDIDEHVYLWFDRTLFDWICKNSELLSQTCYDEVSFVFDQETCVVKGCGVIPLYAG
ncbi:hypothetical protein K2173_009004 [Erythroxylum novogranatense]|uniref:ADP-ribosyl cyclase/cyclic ADP-ribose hydrolase n=1 Tax=Erythroxylum novogranatense TaxID=1862640 RepID=A0AAV8TSN4_9ROSI|nr:hypothetical protein K2173_009004 [Erythroxylum novogranatense]